MPMTTDELRREFLRNALYHSYRLRFFSGWNRLMNFLVLMLGTGVVGDAAARLALNPLWFGLMVTAIGGLQLVYDLGGRARDHQTLRAAYYRTLAEIEAEPEADAARRNGWNAQLALLCADEPPQMAAIDARASNSAALALGYSGDETLLFIPLRARLLGHLLSFDGMQLRTMAERKTGA